MARRHAVQNAHAARWEERGRAPTTRLLQLRVALAAAKSDADLAALVMARSDVTSPEYGRYVRSNEELREHFRPHAHATLAMQRFVDGAKNAHAEANDVGDSWLMTLDVATAEHIFATQLFEFEHRNKQHELRVIRPRGEYAIPEDIADHVVFIDGLESFPTEKQATFMAKSDRHAVGTTLRQDRDPFVIKRHDATLNVDRAKKRVLPEVVTPAMIRQQYDIPDDISNWNGTHPKNTLVIGSFLQEFYTETDLKRFLTEYEPLAVRQDGGLKMPTTRGDCIAPNSHASKPTGEASLDVQVATSIARSDNIEMLCYTNLRDDSRPQAADNQEPFLTFLQDVNAMDSPPSVVSISYTDDECSVPRGYALAVNRELMKTAMKGITVLISAGDAGSQGSHLADFCNIPQCTQFLANFPASSPFVTAVGATTFDTTSSSSGKYREVVTTIKDGALITSGGGFSALFPRPAYQDAAVHAYLKRADNAGFSDYFNIQGRGYPDITGLGHAFPVYVDGEMLPTDGTSVSAPLLASMVVLLNKARLDAGAPVLGFLNPLLYQLYNVCPQVFGDVTEGDISCGSPDMGCCSKGHVATSGWDAASGVGTLRFTRFANDLESCIARIQASGKSQVDPFKGYAAASDVSLLSQSDMQQNGWTAGQRHASQVLLSASMIAGVVLLSVLISLRSNLFATARRNYRFHCNIREPAREYLLADDHAGQ
uniref:subtilisin n=1 Tax=Globisporangium ultimum (strain ATCC 200006 / CBS 805.95 / DAOM BR144) TaxID=431595 RepID=K3XAP6_GLOUD